MEIVQEQVFLVQQQQQYINGVCVKHLYMISIITCIQATITLLRGIVIAASMDDTIQEPTNDLHRIIHVTLVADIDTIEQQQHQ